MTAGPTGSRRYGGVLAASLLVACAPQSEPPPVDHVTPGCSAVLSGAVSKAVDSCFVEAQELLPFGIVQETQIRISFVTRDFKGDFEALLDGALQPGMHVPARPGLLGQISRFAGPTWSSQPATGSPSMVITEAVPTSSPPSGPIDMSIHGNAIATYVADDGTGGTVIASFTF